MRLQRAVSTLIAATGMGLLPGASATADTLPDDVYKWFATSAVSAVTPTHETEVGGPSGTRTAGSYTVGEPTQVLVANVAGDLVPTGEWVAALLVTGQAIGTVTAWRAPSGKIDLAYYDDSAVVGSALEDRADDSELIEDPLGGGRAVVTSDSIVPLEVALDDGVTEVPLEDYLEFVAEELAADRRPSAPDEAGGSPFGGFAAPIATSDAQGRGPLALTAIVVISVAVVGLLLTRPRVYPQRGIL